jgi:biotin carboxyl carrier protein
MSKEKKEILKSEKVETQAEETPVEYTNLMVDGTNYKTLLNPTFLRRKPYVPYNPLRLFSFIPGLIHKVYVAEGDKVTAGTKVMVLDAMKMRNEIRSPIDGVVKTLNVKSGESVPNKHFLIEFAEE